MRRVHRHIHVIVHRRLVESIQLRRLRSVPVRITSSRRILSVAGWLFTNKTIQHAYFTGDMNPVRALVIDMKYTIHMVPSSHIVSQLAHVDARRPRRRMRHRQAVDVVSA